MIYILSLFASFGTFFLRDRLKIHVVQASVLISLTGHLLCSLFFYSNLEFYSSVIYGASFIGMTNIKSYRYVYLIIATSFYLLMFSSYMNWFLGPGGALGFCAFLSVTFTYLVCELTLKFVR